MMKQEKNILKSLLTLGIDYIRWTQLTPMIMIWGFILIMFIAMVFVNFQHQTVATMETLLNSIFQLPFIGESVRQFFTTENNNYHLTTAEIKSWIFTLWSIGSLIFMFLGLLFSYIRKPANPRTLKQKLKITFFAVLLLFVGFMVNYYAEPTNFNGAASGWILNFSLIALIVFIVSSYSLSVSHFLNYLNRQILNE